MNSKLSLLAAISGAMVYREGEPGTDGSAPAAAPVVAPTPINDYTEMKPFTFHFKKEKLRDETGKEVGEGKKLPAANLFLPVPKVSKLVEILQSTGETLAKERALLMDAVVDVVYGVARGQINAFRDIEANKDQPVTLAALNLDKLDWTAIANMPKGERGTSVPSDEDIQSFLDSYLEVMPKAADKSKEKIEVHCALFKAKFKKQRSQKELLEVFQNALGIYIGAVTDDVLEDQLPVVEYYQTMLARMLKSEEKITMDDI